MKIKQWHRAVLTVLISLSCTQEAWAHPELFSEVSFEQAKQQALQDHKVLLVDFTATWCPPCKKMDATTWIDSSVQAWVKENAIAVQIDVDKDRKTSVALKVEAMPTLVIFTADNNDAEFDRQIGYMSAPELLKWLNGAKSGKTSATLEKEKYTSGDGAVEARLGTIETLLRSGRLSEALDELTWLWDKTAQPSSTDSRNFVLVEMQRLAAIHPPAKGKIAQMRDAAQKADNRRDWISLNGILGESDRTLLWFDKAKLDPKQREFIQRNSSALEPALFAKARYSDAAIYLYPDPVKRINEYHQKAQAMMQPRPDTELAKNFDPFPSMVILVYGAYIGAGKQAEAQKIADECLRLDDTQIMRDTLAKAKESWSAVKQVSPSPGIKPAASKTTIVKPSNKNPR